MTNQIHDVISMIDGASVVVHIIEGDLYSRDQKKAFTIQNHEGITNERCSLIEVILYLNCPTHCYLLRSSLPLER